MPKIAQTEMATNKVAGTSVTYSAVGLRAKALASSSTKALVNIDIDVSGSTSGFISNMKTALKEIITALQKDPNAHSMMVRVVAFGTEAHEIHGFIPLMDALTQDYDKIYSGGFTRLFDTNVDSISAMGDYAEQLWKHRYGSNGTYICMTDGRDEGPSGPISKSSVSDVKRALEGAVANEKMESVLSILIGIGPHDAYLQKYKEDAGFSQYEHTTTTTAATFAKLAGWVSQSISSQSQTIGTGTPSKPIAPTF